MTSRVATENIDRFLRLDEVLHITGLGRNTVYRRINLPKTDQDRLQLGGLASVCNREVDACPKPS